MVNAQPEHVTCYKFYIFSTSSRQHAVNCDKNTHSLLMIFSAFFPLFAAYPAFAAWMFSLAAIWWRCASICAVRELCRLWPTRPTNSEVLTNWTACLYRKNLANPQRDNRSLRVHLAILCRQLKFYACSKKFYLSKYLYCYWQTFCGGQRFFSSTFSWGRRRLWFRPNGACVSVLIWR